MGNKMRKYPFVEEEFETVRTIIREKASISRFGDGELRCAVGGGCSSQHGDPKLAEKLKVILKNETKGLLVGIPRSVDRYDWVLYNKKKAHSWVKYRTKRFCDLLNPKSKYYSSFITRTDNALHIGCRQYWDLCKGMWDQRDVIIVQGNEKKITDTKGLFDNVKTLNIVFGPAHHAFDNYSELKMAIKKYYQKDVLFILAMGVCATVLAYDIHLDGYQALDLGHFGAFYNNSFPEKDELIRIEKEAIGNDDVFMNDVSH